MKTLFKITLLISLIISSLFFIVSCNTNYNLESYISEKNIDYTNFNIKLKPTFDKNFSLVRSNYLSAYVKDNSKKITNVNVSYNKETNLINLSAKDLVYNSNYVLYLVYNFKNEEKYSYKFTTKDIKYEKENDYFIIKNKNDLLNIKNGKISGKFLLKDNIDLNNEVLEQLFTSNKLVEFNGNNKTISNFKIDFINYKASIKVKFSLGDNAKFSDNTSEEITILKDSKIKKPKNPTKEGYEFVRWYEYDENQDFDFERVINYPTVIYAKWKKIGVEKEEFYTPQRIFIDSNVDYEVNKFDGIFGDISDSLIKDINFENISTVENNANNSFISRNNYSLISNKSNLKTKIENLTIKNINIDKKAVNGYKNKAQLDATFSVLVNDFNGHLNNITIDNANVNILIQKDNSSDQASFTINGISNKFESDAKLENITIKNSNLKINTFKNSVESTNKSYKISAISQESFINDENNFKNITVYNNNLSIDTNDETKLDKKYLFTNTNLDKKVEIYRQHKETKSYTKLSYSSIIELNSSYDYYIAYILPTNSEYSLHKALLNNQDINFSNIKIGKDKDSKEIFGYKLDETKNQALFITFKLKGNDKIIFDPKKVYSSSDYDILTNEKEINFGQNVRLRLKTSTDNIYNTIYYVRVSARDSKYSSYYIYLTKEQIINSRYEVEIPIYIDNAVISITKFTPQTYQITLISPLQISGKNVNIEKNSINLKAGNLYKGIHKISVSNSTINSTSNIYELKIKNNTVLVDYNQVYNFEYNNISIILDNIKE